MAVVLPAHAVMIAQLTLPQLIAFSEKIFSGKCVSVTEETDSAGRTIQVVTFEVHEMIKGEKADRITFRQMSPDTNVRQEGPVTVVGIEDYVAEFPRYVVGEEALIFLGEASSIGLSAPVGLSQGKFQVIQKETGEKTLLNGKKNLGLFQGAKNGGVMKSMSLNPQEKKLLNVNGGELSYPDFVSVVKKIVQN